MKVEFVELPPRQKKSSFVPKPEFLEVLAKNKGKWAIYRKFTTLKDSQRCYGAVQSWKSLNKKKFKVTKRKVGSSHVIFMCAE